MKRFPRRGDIWWADVADDDTRPCVLLTSDKVLPRMSNVTLVIATSTIRGLDTEVLLTPEEHGVDNRCVVNCHNIQTVPLTSLVEFISHADVDTMNAVDDAIRIALDIA